MLRSLDKILSKNCTKSVKQFLTCKLNFQDIQNWPDMFLKKN